MWRLSQAVGRFAILIITLSIFLSSRINSKIVYGSQKQYIYEDTLPLIKSTLPILSISLLIDVSESQFNKINFACQDLIQTIEELRRVYKTIDLSVSTFTDKPISPLGFNLPTWKDHCLKIETVFEDQQITHLEALQRLVIGGGQDFPESQLDSLYRVAVAPQLHWRSENGLIPATYEPYVKIIILVTDAMYHKSGDVQKALQAYSPYSGTDGSVNVPPHSLSTLKLSEDPNADCDTTDYPSVYKLGELLKNKHFLPIIITAPAHYICTDDMSKTCPYPEMEALAKETNNPDYADTVKGMELIYTDLLEELDVTGIVQHIEASSSEFSTSLLRSLKTLLTYNLPIEEITAIPEDTNLSGSSSTPPNSITKFCSDDSEVSVKINVTVT